MSRTASRPLRTPTASYKTNTLPAGNQTNPSYGRTQPDRPSIPPTRGPPPKDQNIGAVRDARKLPPYGAAKRHALLSTSAPIPPNREQVQPRRPHNPFHTNNVDLLHARHATPTS